MAFPAIKLTLPMFYMKCHARSRSDDYGTFIEQIALILRPTSCPLEYGLALVYNLFVVTLQHAMALPPYFPVLDLCFTERYSVARSSTQQSGITFVILHVELP